MVNITKNGISETLSGWEPGEVQPLGDHFLFTTFVDSLKSMD
jgi:hypothetical protein